MKQNAIKFRQFVNGKIHEWGYKSVNDKGSNKVCWTFVPPLDPNVESDKLIIVHPGIGCIYENDILYGDNWKIGASVVKLHAEYNDDFSHSVYVENINKVGLYCYFRPDDLDAQCMSESRSERENFNIQKIGNIYENKDLLGWGMRITRKHVSFNDENKKIYHDFLHGGHIRWAFMSDKEIDYELEWLFAKSTDIYDGSHPYDAYSIAMKIMKQNENEIKGVILNESQ